jgi:tetratricopeptide (TPR) repeat protein
MDGEITLAQELYESMHAVDKRGASLACMALVDIDMTNGRWDEAIQKLRVGIDRDRSNDNARGEAAKVLMLAECLSGKQDARSLVEELDRARALNLEPARLVTLGALYAKAGDVDKARSVADELGSKLGRHERAYGRIVGAECFAAENKFGDAVDMLSAAFDLADVWYGHFLRAQLFVRAGHVFEGLEEHEACKHRCGEAAAIYLDDVPTFRFVQQARELHQRAIELL